MEGYLVQLYLTTPLFPFDFEEDGKRHTFPMNVVVLEGLVKGTTGGYWLSGIRGGSRGAELAELPGLTEAVIPGSKVDFVRVIRSAEV